MATANIDIVVRTKGAREVKRDLEDVGKGAEKATSAVGFLKSALAGLATAAALNQLRQYADAWTETTNKIRLATKSSTELKLVQEDLFKVAQRTRQSFGATVDLFGRLSAAGRELGKSQSDIIKFTEGIGMALEISGTSAQQAAGGLMQLGQALGSATIQAEEFNSLADSMPRVLRAVAENIPGMEGSISKLKNAVKDGEITSKEFFDAFMKALPKLREEFEKLNPTITSAFTVMNNAIGKFIGESDEAAGVSTTIARAIITLAENLKQVVAVSAAVGAGLLVAFGPQLVGYLRAATGAMRAFTIAVASNPIGALAVAIAAVTAYLVMMRDEIKLTEDGLVTLADGMSAAWDMAVEVTASTVETISSYWDAGISWINEQIAGMAEWWNGSSADILDVIKTVVNVAVGLWMGFFNSTIAIWKGIIPALKDIGIQAVNGLISVFDGALSSIVDGINYLRQLAGLSAMDYIPIGRLKNETAGAAADLGTAISDSFRDSLSTDYVQTFSDGLDELGDRARRKSEERRWAELEEEEKRRKAREDMMIEPDAKTGSDDPNDKKIKTLKQYLAELQSETTLLQLVGREREIAGEFLRIENALREDGIALTKSQRDELMKAIEANHEAVRVNQQMERIWQDIKGPSEEYHDTLKAINALMAQGKLTANEYATAISNARSSFLDSQTDALSGFERGLLNVGQTINDVASATEDLVTNAFSNMEDSLVEFVTTGEFSIEKLVNGLLADSTRALFRELAGNMLKGTGLESIFGGGNPGDQAATAVTNAAQSHANTVVTAAQTFSQIVTTAGQQMAAANPITSQGTGSAGASGSLADAQLRGSDTGSLSALRGVGGGSLRGSTSSLSDMRAAVSGGSSFSGMSGNVLTLSAQDVTDLKKTLMTEWVQSAGPEQAAGIVDTILNRTASGKWGNTVTSVVNARSQFSDINGRPAWQKGRNSVDDWSDSVLTRGKGLKASQFVDDYLARREAGERSSVGDHLNYANPNYSDKSNLGWINKLDGPVYGKGDSIHRHGTTADLQKYRPGEFQVDAPGGSDYAAKRLEQEKTTTQALLQEGQTRNQQLLTQQQTNAQQQLSQVQQTEVQKLQVEQQAAVQALQKKHESEQQKISAEGQGLQQALAQKQQTEMQKLQMEQQTEMQALMTKQTNAQQMAAVDQQTTASIQQAVPAHQQLASSIQQGGQAASSASMGYQSAGVSLSGLGQTAQTATPGMDGLAQGIGGLMGPLNQVVPGLGSFATAILNLLSSLGSGGGGGGLGGIGGLLQAGLGLFAGGFATGGSFTVPGTGSPDSKMVSMALTPGEKVTIQTPSQQRNGEGAPAGQATQVSQQPIRVVNVIDPNEALSAMGSSAGERVILNAIERNPSVIKRYLS